MNGGARSFEDDRLPIFEESCRGVASATPEKWFCSQPGRARVSLVPISGAARDPALAPAVRLRRMQHLSKKPI